VTILSQYSPSSEDAIYLLDAGCQKKHATNNNTKPMKSIQNALFATSLLGIMSANAEPTGLLYGKLTGETPFDQAWSAFNLHKDDDNQILQEFSLQGRLQIQSIYGEAEGESINTKDFKDQTSLGINNDESLWGNDIEARRARFGFKSKWFQVFKFDGLINVDTDAMDNSGDDTLYKDLYELYITYAPSDAFNLSVGKNKVRFTREQETSSNNILTLERSLGSNTLFPGELTGIWTSGKGIKGGWLYELGVYGNDRSREFTSGDGGKIVIAKIGYDYAERVGYDTAVASLHYMHNTQPGYQERRDAEYTGGVSPDFTNSIALTNEITQGRFGLNTELLYGFGFQGKAQRHNTTAPFAYGAQNVDQGDIMGITVMPSYYIAEGLQLVGRLQVLAAEDTEDLRLPSRYERLVSGAASDERGVTYVSTYLGLNYYVYGHKLKLMNGVEYSHLGGGEYDGYTFMSGLRFSF
jgi:phosphate-selective porin OprO/OprP